MWLQQSSEERLIGSEIKRVRGKITEGFIRLCRISSFCLECSGESSEGFSKKIHFTWLELLKHHTGWHVEIRFWREAANAATGKPVRRFLQLFKRGMIAWPRMGAVKVVKTGQILNRFWRCSLQNFLDGLDMSAKGKSHIKVTLRFLAQQKDRAAIQQDGNTWVEGVLGGRSGFRFGGAVCETSFRHRSEDARSGPLIYFCKLLMCRWHLKPRTWWKAAQRLKAGHFTIKVEEKRKNVTKSKKDWSVRWEEDGERGGLRIK